MYPTQSPLLKMPSAPLTFDDEAIASRSSARLLITAVASTDAESRARRVHGLSPRRQFPFVRTEASNFPIEPGRLRDTCSRLLDEAAGGTIFINNVEAMPLFAQDVFVELLGELEATRQATAAIRLVAGTTVSLRECIAAGTFVERLFYRLNVIHLTPADDRPLARRSHPA